MIEVVMLVATLGLNQPTRVVSADWPFFRSLAECQQAAMSMRNIPRIVDTVVCEARVLDVSTGRVLP